MTVERAQPASSPIAGTASTVKHVGEILAYLGLVREAYIYGSWAARYVGETGSAPRDLDVLLMR